MRLIPAQAKKDFLTNLAGLCIKRTSLRNLREVLMKIVDLTAEHKAYAIKTSKGWALTKRYSRHDPVMFSEETPEFLTDKGEVQVLYAQTCAMGVDGAIKKAKRPEDIKIYKFDLAVATLRVSCKKLSEALGPAWYIFAFT